MTLLFPSMLVRRVDEHRDRIWRATTAAALILFAGFVAGAAASAWGGGGNTLGRAMLAALWLNIGLTLIGLRRRDGGGAAPERAAEIAARDAPVGVATRRGLSEAGAAQLRAAHARGRAAALLLIVTPDGIDTAEAAAEIAAALPGDALLARVDERTFAGLFVFDQRALGHAQRIAGALVGAGSAAAVGIAVSEKTGTIETLLREAETALTAAREGGGVRHFTHAMADALRSRAALERDLRAALPAGEIAPAFERQVDLASGRLTGLEVRGCWTRADGRTLGCDAFLPCAQDIGIADELWLQVMRQAFAAARDWDGVLPLTARVSPAQFRDAWLPQKIIRTLTETGFPASRLEIEVTEAALHDNLPLARSIVGSLKNQGVRVALGGFGAGPMSLTRLRALPFDRIAVDPVLVGALGERGAAPATVAAIAGLGDSLNLPVAAAGVADAEGHARLLALGCARAQGPHYGPVLSLADARRLLASRRTPSDDPAPRLAAG